MLCGTASLALFLFFLPISRLLVFYNFFLWKTSVGYVFTKHLFDFINIKKRHVYYGNCSLQCKTYFLKMITCLSLEKSKNSLSRNWKPTFHSHPSMTLTFPATPVIPINIIKWLRVQALYTQFVPTIISHAVTISLWGRASHVACMPGVYTCKWNNWKII